MSSTRFLLELVRNAESQAPLQIYCVRVCILIRSLGNSYHMKTWRSATSSLKGPCSHLDFDCEWDGVIEELWAQEPQALPSVSKDQCGPSHWEELLGSKQREQLGGDHHDPGGRCAVGSRVPSKLAWSCSLSNPSPLLQPFLSFDSDTQVS